MKKKLKILAAADLHGDFEAAKKLSKKGLKEKVDLVILAGDIYGYESGKPGILEPFSKNRQKVVFVPGNCDFSEEKHMLEKHAKSIHHYYVTYNDVGIVGVGSPDWKLQLTEDDFKMIKKNFYKMKPNKKILVSHLHATGTKAEFSGIPGDDFVKEVIERFKPDMVISGHIHEAEGLEDKIQNTKIIQVGRKGKILEI